ncbi:serine hydrolase domain-containing protein [Flagellimonas aequoris]|uniref:Beta-lactamase family protein n=1 Tax=Flagellimonas aequoris TaxID=2306997 RepID=A0A418N409_9FLAO|nr:serine hydrolase domain-containing protein [Allomuricauda aequoris]RIV68575.1 class A beta-lactamase-related serine hydrolase [Allomuricauda aequoris]TXK00273.1 beta-lactamase family protein [Allomuricauda aequoris]
MKRYISIVVIILTLCVSCKNKTNSIGTENSLKNRLESYIVECNKNGLSASVLVAKDGEILYSGGVGLRNKTEKLPVTEETIFTIGSLTKQFTATAILKLQEEDKLSVNDSISKFFENVPKNKQNITIHQLLTHTSGIVGNLGYGVDFVPISKEKFLSEVYNSPLDFKPGKQFSYSNVGYSILAMIIEKVAQTDYETYLQENLFQKAGMKHTGYLSPKWDTTQMAHGYKCGEDWGTHLMKWQADSNQISWHLKGNGGILSNPSDLYKWYLALKENKIISKKSFEQLTFPHVKENESGDSHYAYGWTIMNSDRNTKMIAHNGSNGVFYADFMQLPAENTVIIYMTNELRYDTQIVAWEIEQILFSEDYTPIVPKMNSIKHASTDIANKQLEIIHQFVKLILTEDENIDDFVNKHVASKERERRFKMWMKDMQKEFLGYRLNHILEYGDMSYDIVLESKDGKVVDLTPCFDLQFNESDQIVAFGW